MASILTPKEILQDELDPRIFLKIERLRGPTAWDYDSLIKHSDNSPINWMTKMNEYSNKCRNPCGIQSYADINIVNNNDTKVSVGRDGEFIIGIKALRSVEFKIDIGGNLITTIAMKSGEYRNDIIAEYPIPIIMLFFHSIIFEFLQGSMNDIVLVYSHIQTSYIRPILSHKCVHPCINPNDPDNKYNMVYISGMADFMENEKLLNFLTRWLS